MEYPDVYHPIKFALISPHGLMRSRPSLNTAPWHLHIQKQGYIGELGSLALGLILILIQLHMNQ